MGYYINKDSKGNDLGMFYDNKIASLLMDGAAIVNGTEYEPNLICVVDNGLVAGAGYCYCEEEYRAFAKPDGRQKTWLIHPKAQELAK